MAKAIGKSSSCFIIGDNGTVFDFSFVVDGSHGGNLLEVQVSVDDEVVGIPIRFKGAGSSIAADFPGLNGPFVVDENDHITDG